MLIGPPSSAAMIQESSPFSSGSSSQEWNQYKDKDIHLVLDNSICGTIFASKIDPRSASSPPWTQQNRTYLNDSILDGKGNDAPLIGFRAELENSYGIRKGRIDNFGHGKQCDIC